MSNPLASGNGSMFSVNIIALSCLKCISNQHLEILVTLIWISFDFAIFIFYKNCNFYFIATFGLLTHVPSRSLFSIFFLSPSFYPEPFFFFSILQFLILLSLCRLHSPSPFFLILLTPVIFLYHPYSSFSLSLPLPPFLFPPPLVVWKARTTVGSWACCFCSAAQALHSHV